jgi:antitoxin ChpS
VLYCNIIVRALKHGSGGGRLTAVSAAREEIPMYRTRLRTVGGSVMFAIPKAILESLDLKANASVGLSVDQGKLIVDPRPVRRYTLEELVAACDTSALATAEDAEWLGDPPVGRETI